MWKVQELEDDEMDDSDTDFKLDEEDSDLENSNLDSLDY